MYVRGKINVNEFFPVQQLNKTDLVLAWFQRLDEQDFDERRDINKRKKMILEGRVRIMFYVSFLFSVDVCP
jgi:hypothetical protein